MNWSLQAYESKSAYLSQLPIVELMTDPAVIKFVREIPPIDWCLYANISTYHLFGWMTSNFVGGILALSSFLACAC